MLKQLYSNGSALFRVFPRHGIVTKSYLRAHNLTRSGHNIQKLYEECSALGLATSRDDRFGLGNVVSLLQSGNADMGFRYFTLKSTWRPDLNWTRETVGELMQFVSRFVDSKKNTVPGTIAKLVITVGKPIPKENAA